VSSGSIQKTPQGMQAGIYVVFMQNVFVRVTLHSKCGLILAKEIQRFLVHGVVYKVLGTHLAKEIQREYSGCNGVL
jgi:hypothetical protein